MNLFLFSSQIDAVSENRRMDSIETEYDDLTTATIATIESLDNIELIQIPNNLKSRNDNEITIGIEDDGNLQSIDMENIPIVDQMHTNQIINETNGLELIKIVDQFEVEDQIEFRDCELLSNGMYDMTDINCWNSDSNEFSSLCHNDTLIDNSLMQPMFSTIKSLKLPTLTKPSLNPIGEQNGDNDDDLDEVCQNLNLTELEIYTNWMNSVIERLNITMDYNDNGYPEPIILSIPHVI